MEINPRHPLIKELQRRISEEEADQTTVDLAHVLYETAVLRSGYALKDSSHFAGRIERMLRLSLGVDVEAPVRGAWGERGEVLEIMGELGGHGVRGVWEAMGELEA